MTDPLKEHARQMTVALADKIDREIAEAAGVVYRGFCPNCGIAMLGWYEYGLPNSCGACRGPITLPDPAPDP